MTRERLYIVHGMGNDAVGLVGSITTPIAGAGGNIVDLRQDVLHGLFTIFMVVDLSACDLRIDSFRDMVKKIAEDTGIELGVEKYYPIARNPEKKNMLLVLVGGDQPGIIASISRALAKYRINIEFSQTIGREDVFLMELLTDISAASLPLDNLTTELTRTMADMGIQTIVQTSDVFNKKKRVIMFDIAGSFMPGNLVEELLRQTGLSNADLKRAYTTNDPADVCSKAASLLEGFPFEAMNAIAQSITAAPGTSELLQTLKIMGYRIGLVSNAFSVFTDSLGARLGLDHCLGIRLDIDDDTRTAAGGYAADERAARNIQSVIRSVSAHEGTGTGDVTVLSDSSGRHTPGIRLDFNQETIINLYNKKIMTRDNLIGILGSFGVPRS
jgi:phosphoserine phosphatase